MTSQARPAELLGELDFGFGALPINWSDHDLLQIGYRDEWYIAIDMDGAVYLHKTAPRYNREHSDYTSTWQYYVGYVDHHEYVNRFKPNDAYTSTYCWLQCYMPITGKALRRAINEPRN